MRLLFTLLSILLLVGCIITKRHFGPGYHVEWKKSVSKAEKEVEKTDLTDLKKLVSEKQETDLEINNYFIDSADLIKRSEVIAEKFEPNEKSYLKDSEPKFDEVLLSPVERITVLKEPDEEAIQPTRKVDSFALAALGSLLLGLLLLLTIGFADMTLGILLVVGILMILFSIISLIRILRHPELYKAKVLTWILFWLSMAGIGAALVILIFYLGYTQ